MTTNEEILNKASEINQRIVSENEEKEEIEIIDNSPVYVLEDSIPDVLALNELNNKIDEKKNVINTKENELETLNNQRNDLSDKIGAINDGQHRNEVALNLSNLRELDEQRESKRIEIEDEYSSLRVLEKDQKSLDDATRKMVREMTNEYNTLDETSQALVNEYRESANYKVFEESNKLFDKLNNYKKFESFEAILNSAEEKEETKEDQKEEQVEETKTDEATVEETNIEEKTEDVKNEEVTEEVKEEIPVLNEVKTDEISESTQAEIDEILNKLTENVETKETNTEAADNENEKVVGTTETTEPQINNQLTPSFDDILVDNENKPEEKQTENASYEITIFPNKTSKIADSTKKGIIATIDVFNKKNEVTDEATLKLTPKNA